jgi:hypothetical protein
MLELHVGNLNAMKKTADALMVPAEIPARRNWATREEGGEAEGIVV